MFNLRQIRTVFEHQPLHFQPRRPVRVRPAAPAGHQGRPLDRDSTRGPQLGRAAADAARDRRKVEVRAEADPTRERGLEASDAFVKQQSFKV